MKCVNCIFCTIALCDIPFHIFSSVNVNIPEAIKLLRIMFCCCKFSKCIKFTIKVIAVDLS